MSLAGRNLTVSEVQFSPRAGDPSRMEVFFKAVAPEGTGGDRAVILNLDGYETSFLLASQEGTVLGAAIYDLVSYPNPMTDQAHFLFRTGLQGVEGRIQIYSLTGKPVTTVPIRADQVQGNQAMIRFEGRDERGDRLANGVYLYRVILDDPAGPVTSGIQRLVVMR
jgi:hypothetical protein